MENHLLTISIIQETVLTNPKNMAMNQGLQKVYILYFLVQFEQGYPLQMINSKNYIKNTYLKPSASIPINGK